MKDTSLREGLRLEFRAEIFNLLDRANFNTPNLIVFTPPTNANPDGALRNGGRRHQHVDYVPAGAIWAKAAVVENQLSGKRLAEKKVG